MEVILVFIVLIALMVILTIIDIVMNWLMMRRIDRLETIVNINDSFLNSLIKRFSEHIKEEENGKEEKV